MDEPRWPLAPLTPARVELAREGVGKLAREIGIDPAADDVVVDREARGPDRAKHRVAQFGAVIELAAIGGFEQQPADADGLHQIAIAGQDGGVVEMARKRQVRACRGLSCRGFAIAAQDGRSLHIEMKRSPHRQTELYSANSEKSGPMLTR